MAFRYSQVGTAFVSNSAAETSILKVAQVYEANTMDQGQTIRVQAKGTYNTKASAPGTLTLQLKFGNAAATSGARTLTAAITSLAWDLDAHIIIASPAGPSSSATIQGYARFSTSATAVETWTLSIGASLDTTSNMSLDLTAQFSVADVNNLIQTNTFL